MVAFLRRHVRVPLAPLAALAGKPARAVDPSKQVDLLIGKYVHADGPGMAVVVVKNGKVVHKQGYGLADLEKNIKITPQTTFELASVSKQFTGMAIMVLCDQEKLSLTEESGSHSLIVRSFCKCRLRRRGR